MTTEKQRNHKRGGNQINVLQRQQQLITLLGSGKSLKEISTILNCSIDTLYKDKQEISIKGLNELRDLGNANLCFYFSTIISDMNNVKEFLWSILKSGKGSKDSKSQISIKDKINASIAIIKCDDSLRELYKDSIASILIDDYRTRLHKLENILEIEQTNNQDNNKPINYFTQQLPKVKKETDDTIQP